MGALALFVFTIGLSIVKVSDAIIINNTHPIFTLLLGTLIFKEKITSRSLKLVLIGFLGTILVVSAA
jgi:drug/metabolite transporter (DMT)-like permease